MSFKTGDVVKWHGAIGKVVGMYGSSLYCDFYQKSGSQFRRDMICFTHDGVHKPYHLESSLEHASHAESEAFNLNPPSVSRGVSFNGS